ncbi:MAG TPA: histidine phosphatase family protein [Miltoncostaeaceae bacterium]|nr:histidine phosphatase family protein [Miltoncostaeaceae bacterium]
MRLILLRHGESTWNAQGRMQGTADPPLSDAGRAQARALAPLLAGLEPDAVVTSDLRRARQTADELGLAAAEPDPRWREAGLGRWVGRLVDEVVAEGPDNHDGGLEGSAAPPGGEAFADTCVRVAAAIGALASRAERALVVTHGGPIRAACATAAGLPRSGLVAVPTASLTEIAVPDGGPGWVVAFGVTARGAVRPAPP